MMSNQTWNCGVECNLIFICLFHFYFGAMDEKWEENLYVKKWDILFIIALYLYLWNLIVLWYANVEHIFFLNSHLDWVKWSHYMWQMKAPFICRYKCFSVWECEKKTAARTIVLLIFLLTVAFYLCHTINK